MSLRARRVDFLGGSQCTGTALRHCICSEHRKALGVPSGNIPYVWLFFIVAGAAAAPISPRSTKAKQCMQVLCFRITVDSAQYDQAGGYNPLSLCCRNSFSLLASFLDATGSYHRSQPADTSQGESTNLRSTHHQYRDAEHGRRQVMGGALLAAAAVQLQPGEVLRAVPCKLSAQ